MVIFIYLFILEMVDFIRKKKEATTNNQTRNVPYRDTPNKQPAKQYKTNQEQRKQTQQNTTRKPTPQQQHTNRKKKHKNSQSLPYRILGSAYSQIVSERIRGSRAVPDQQATMSESTTSLECHILD